MAGGSLANLNYWRCAGYSDRLMTAPHVRGLRGVVYVNARRAVLEGLYGSVVVAGPSQFAPVSPSARAIGRRLAREIQDDAGSETATPKPAPR
jgi:hypothetical protein